MADDTFTCRETPISWPTAGQDQACRDCGTVWEREPVTIGAGAQIKEPAPGFPEGFQGAGPMYAAVSLGYEWLGLASQGETTYVLGSPDVTDPAASGAYTGWSAFLDRGQAEQLADARDGTFTRWDGLSGHNDWTAKKDAEFRQADAEMTAFLDSRPEAGS